MSTTTKKSTAKTATKKSTTTKKSAVKTAPKTAGFFAGLETIEEIRVQFLESLEGISADTAKAMFEEYLKAAKKYGNKHRNAKGKIYEADPAIAPKDWAKMILKIYETEGLSLTFKSPSGFNGRWLWVTGKTKENREILKSYGFSWCPSAENQSRWVLKTA